MKNPDNLMTASEQLELLRNFSSNRIDRGLGTNGWKFQKWMEMCHLLLKITVYGSPRARDTNSGERHLKILAVRLSKTSQKKDDSIFKQQVNLRHTEAEMLDDI